MVYVFLICFGSVLVIASYFLQEEKNNKSKEEGAATLDLEEVEQKMQQIGGRVSNQKMMEMNEFAGQVLEKIKENHEEVLFLYQLLQEKEAKLLETLKEVSIKEKKAQEKEQEPEKKIEPPKAILLKEKEQRNTKKERNRTAKKGKESKNQKILQYYEQGKTEQEIAKLLDLGQGEVKLILNLFTEKK